MAQRWDARMVSNSCASPKRPTNVRAERHEPPPRSRRGHGFGTTPVFLAGVSTILGAIMFLRFGYAVGNVGLLGAVAIIVLGHMVTVPTALAIAEIATNRRVEGGGEYYIISRSFGLRIGSAIGFALYLSQAISVAFYCIAFAEAFSPLGPGFESLTGIEFDPRMVSIPITVVLIAVMLTKGAAIGVKLLAVVAAVLALSLVLFFLGDPLPAAPAELRLTERIDDGDPFFVVFAICFPAFTGMTAGVGLSGDLARPSRSIPLGTMAATAVGFVVYLGLVYKLSTAAPPGILAEDQLVMSRIALWGPIVPIGLGCATLSSAIGSMLVAPRTLQALGHDGSFPLGAVNRALGHGVGRSAEPRNATVVTAAIALSVVALGDVNFVARLISMFFMVTYGALCTISFLEHFAAHPSYRPSFKSRWWLSLFGALMCLLMMFQMDPIYAGLAIAAMVGIYAATKLTPAGAGGDNLAAIIQGAMRQAIRRMHIRLQRSRKPKQGKDWRPAIVMISSRTFTGSRAPLELLGWLCERYGFGTYLHYIAGFLNEQSYRQSVELQQRLVEMCHDDFPGVFVDTMVSPSTRSALAQVLQTPGVSGMKNNTLLFEMSATDSAEELDELVGNVLFAGVAQKNLLVLRHGPRHFGLRRQIHIWLTWHDQTNATLMVLLAYILLGQAEWRKAEMHIFAGFPSSQVDEEHDKLVDWIRHGRIPISPSNIIFHSVDEGEAFAAQVASSSAEADLVLMGFTLERLRAKGPELLLRHADLGDVLFVCAGEKVIIE